MNFPYLIQTTATADIEIENIGNVCLCANNDVAEEWYLYIHTVLGRTTIIEFGPVESDIDELPDFVSFTYSKIDFNEKKLDGIIDKFLNNPKRVITQVTEIDAETFKSRIKDIKRYIV